MAESTQHTTVARLFAGYEEELSKIFQNRLTTDTYRKKNNINFVEYDNWSHLYNLYNVYKTSQESTTAK